MGQPDDEVEELDIQQQFNPSLLDNESGAVLEDQTKVESLPE
jgi:hypothetical protein